MPCAVFPCSGVFAYVVDPCVDEAANETSRLCHLLLAHCPPLYALAAQMLRAVVDKHSADERTPQAISLELAGDLGAAVELYDALDRDHADAGASSRVPYVVLDGGGGFDDHLGLQHSRS